jgi:putative intracellular protease/amidase
MDVTVLVFNGVTSREVVGPLTALNDVQECTVRWVARQPGTVHGFEPVQRFDVTDGVDQVAPTDLLLIPGGLGSIRMMEDPEVVAWVAASAEQARVVMSVSTGSLLLAAAGLLTDRDASGHWLASGELEAAGAHPSESPVTWTGNLVTTSGATAAAEVAATLPERLLYGAAD